MFGSMHCSSGLSVLDMYQYYMNIRAKEGCKNVWNTFKKEMYS
jgi:hypothetical protein